MPTKEEHFERTSRLSPADIEAIKKQLLESIYADIGRSLVKKFLWTLGTLVFALFVGLKAAGKLPWSD